MDVQVFFCFTYSWCFFFVFYCYLCIAQYLIISVLKSNQALEVIKCKNKKNNYKNKYNDLLTLNKKYLNLFCLNCDSLARQIWCVAYKKRIVRIKHFLSTKPLIQKIFYIQKTKTYKNLLFDTFLCYKKYCIHFFLLILLHNFNWLKYFDKFYKILISKTFLFLQNGNILKSIC